MLDSSYLFGKGQFENDGPQNYLVFQPAFRYFKTLTNSGRIEPWESKGLSGERIKPPATSDNSLNPEINYTDSFIIRVKFDWSCLKEEKVAFDHKTILNL